MSQLLEALNNTADGAFVVDENLRIIYWNDAAEELLKFNGGVIADKPCYRILKGCDEENRLICKKRCKVAELALRFKPVSNYDVRMHTQEGDSRWLNMSIFPDQIGENGDKKVVVHLFRDINGKKEDEIFLRSLLDAARRYHSIPSEVGTEPEILLGELTQREFEVLTLLAQGYGTRDIGQMFSISTNTVRNHIQHILEKLQVHSRLEAVAFAIKNSLVG